MSRVIFMTLGSKGDLLPFIGLAREMRALGHSVMIMSCEPYRHIIEHEGFEFESIMSKADFDQLDSPELWTPIRGLRFYIRNCVVKSAPAVIRAVERQVERHGSDLALVCNHMLAGGFAAAEKFDLPITAVFLQPFSHVSAEEPSKFSPHLDPLLEAVGPRVRRWAIRGTHALMQSQMGGMDEILKLEGIRPWKNYFRDVRYGAGLVLGLWPEWYCPRKADWPGVCQSVGFVNTSSSETRWRDGHALSGFLDREPIVFAMGSEMTQNFAANVPLFEQTCRALNRPGLFVSPALRERDFEFRSPDFVIAKSAPFTQVFERASAIVCHGGIGTLAKAFVAGRPIVCLPMAYDQFDNGHLVERLGAGRSIARIRTSQEKLTATLRDVVNNPSTTMALRTLQERMRRENGASRAAHLMTSYFVKAA